MFRKMDLTRGILIGALAGVSLGYLAGSDKTRQMIMCAAKKTMGTVENTVKEAVDFCN